MGTKLAGPKFTNQLGEIILRLNRLGDKYAGMRLEERFQRGLALIYECQRANFAEDEPEGAKSLMGSTWESLAPRRASHHDLRMLRNWLSGHGSLRILEAATGVSRSTLSGWVNDGLPKTFGDFDRVVTFIERNTA